MKGNSERTQKKRKKGNCNERTKLEKEEVKKV